MAAEIEYLDEKELLGLLNSLKKERDLIAVRLLYELGCTIKELVGIRVRDIDVSARTVTIKRQNSRNEEDRIVRVSGDLSGMLNEYLASMGLQDRKLSYLFETARKTPLTTRRIFQIVAKACKESGISRMPSPQLIKYTHIVHAYKKGVPIVQIQHHVGIAQQRLAQILEALKLEKDEDAYEAFFRSLK